MAPGPNTPTSWLSRTLSSAMVALVSGQKLAVGIGDLQDCRVLDVAHRAPGGEAPIVRIERCKQWVERIVQKRLFARIAVIESFCIGALVVGQGLPSVEQFVDGGLES